MDISIKNVVFDLDGTLVNSNPASLRSLQKTIKIIENRFLTIEELEIVLGLSDFNTFEILGISNKTRCYSVWKKISKELDSEKLIFPEVIETLNQLKSFGINIGIVTLREKSRYYDDRLIMSELNDFLRLLLLRN